MLLLEDENDFRDGVEHYLCSRGYRDMVVSNGVEGIARS